MQSAGLCKTISNKLWTTVDKVKKLDTNSFKTWKASTSLQSLCLLWLSLPACLQWRPDVPFIAVACPRSAEKQFHSGQIWLWHFSPGQKPAHSYSGRFPNLDTQLTHLSYWYSLNSVSLCQILAAMPTLWWMWKEKSDLKSILRKLLSLCVCVYSYWPEC